MTQESIDNVRAAQAANDAFEACVFGRKAVHDDAVLDPAPETELEKLLETTIIGNQASDAGLLRDLHNFVVNEVNAMPDRIAALSHIDTVMDLTPHNPPTEADVQLYIEEADCVPTLDDLLGDPVVDDDQQEILDEVNGALNRTAVSVDDVLASQSYPVGTSEDQAPIEMGPGEAGVAIAAETKAQAAEVKVKKPRRTPVKGVMAKARELFAAGCDDAGIRTALYEMYTAAGRDEKNAQEMAQLIFNEVKKTATTGQ